MRAYVPGFDMAIPSTWDEALEMLSTGEWKPFAGGTDLMVLFEAGKLQHHRYVSLLGLPATPLTVTKQLFSLSALSTYTQVRRATARDFPMLAQAASETGSIAIQNRGTLGGNIANASPAADSPPALLAYDAQIGLLSTSGTRWVPYASFHTGYKTTKMEPGEVISYINIPRREPGWRDYYRKVGTRKAQAISKVCIAASVKAGNGMIEQVRIALGSVAPVPLRCTTTEQLLIGQALNPRTIAMAKESLESEIAPISDIRSTEIYRRRVAGNLLEQFLKSL
jgi:CO/xanthine dehydrogenase FAD-binding subunit